MARTTEKMLLDQVATLNKLTGDRFGFVLEAAYGGWRLGGNGGSRDVSGYMTAGGLHLWMNAFIQGLDHAIKAGYYAETHEQFGR